MEVDDNAPRRPSAVVAVAASAGGVEALSAFVSALPEDFPASVLVVLHIPPQGPSVLPGILERAGLLPSRHPVDGEKLEAGVIFVAPPDRHLAVSDGVARVAPGPKENGHRPSADVLLRSVAEVYGWRSAGVVLSGTMDDGAAGLSAVVAFGGLAMVQDPSEAAFPGMPTAAIEAAEGAVVVPVKEMATQLRDWLEEQGGALAREAAMSIDDPPDDYPEGEVTPFTCPECGGSLWNVDDYGMEKYRCRVGHAFSTDSLLAGKQNALEAALWAAIVALEEKADLCRRISKRLEEAGRTVQVERYQQDIVAIEQQLGFLRRMVDDLLITSPDDAEQGGAGDGTTG